jgi:4-hydroxyphenylpyruvate dioxygenase
LRVAYPWSINRLVITSPAIGSAVKWSAQGCPLRLQIDSARLGQDGPDNPGQLVSQGDDGFGEGNFKALFESMERDQIRRGVLEAA